MPIPYLTKLATGLNSKSTDKANFFATILHKVMMRKARIVWSHIGKYLIGEKILDVGMGSGSISNLIINKGFLVTSVDVNNLSIYDDLRPVVYDGSKMPFIKNEFDTAVIIHVLHHCNDGLHVLAEAKRCAKRVVVIEDTFRNKFEWFWVAVFDALTNGELWWHKYHTVSEWKKYIKKNGWKLVYEDQWSESCVTAPYGRYCMFVIE